MHWLLLLLVVLQLVRALYLPGIAPINFEKEAPVELKVNSLDSIKTQLPIEYYQVAAFCKPESDPELEREVSFRVVKVIETHITFRIWESISLETELKPRLINCL
jgi:hypothetical protein